MRRAWALAAAEARRAAVRIDRRVIAGVLVVAGLLATVATVTPLTPPSPEDGLYLVRDEGSPLRDAVAASERFRFTEENAHVVINGDEVRYDPNNAASREAAAVLEVAVRHWLDQELRGEADQAAAFPLEVRLVQAARAPALPDGGPGSGEGKVDPNPGAGDVDVADDVDPQGVVRPVAPDRLEPPFPVQSLLLTFAYLIPASLVTQLHAGNLHSERQGRATVILAGPVTPAAFLVGKVLPWSILLGLLAILVTWVIGAGLWALAGAAVAMFFLLAMATWLALIARTTRELTLLQVAGSTLLNVFLFLPPLFPGLDAVAFLSPIHLVALDLQGASVPLGGALYATVPMLLATVSLAALSTGLARDEVLTTAQPPVPQTIQALEAVTRRPWQLFLAAVLTIPFVLATEATAVAMGAVFFLSAPALILVVVAVVEETAKGLPIWARRGDGGILVGTGFFVGEKAALLLTLVGFSALPFGGEVLLLLGIGAGLLLFLPLALHAGTAWVQGFSTKRGHARLGWVLAVVIHLAYDLAILEVLL